MYIPVTYFNNLDEGSTFISASGGTITFDGIYKIHTFTATGSNTFTIHSLANTASNNDFDIVIVGGGGGGCSSVTGAGGGGGAGQAIYSQSLQFTATGNYTASVGNGGLKNSTSIFNNPGVTSRRGTKGLPSFFSGSIFNIKVLGGGPGCIIDQFPSSSAQAIAEEIACGGGAGFGRTGGGPFPGEYPFVSGSIGTLFNGGNYIASDIAFNPSRQSGGGGGASAFSNGASGTWGLPVPGGDGANGVSTTINGFTRDYGGGGGGARNSDGGSGGGGASLSRGGENGVNGQGGGGGGSLEEFFGTPDAGNGGSGAVVIRYRYK